MVISTPLLSTYQVSFCGPQRQQSPNLAGGSSAWLPAGHRHAQTVACSRPKQTLIPRLGQLHPPSPSWDLWALPANRVSPSPFTIMTMFYSCFITLLCCLCSNSSGVFPLSSPGGSTSPSLLSSLHLSHEVHGPPLLWRSPSHLLDHPATSHPPPPPPPLSSSPSIPEPLPVTLLPTPHSGHGVSPPPFHPPTPPNQTKPASLELS